MRARPFSPRHSWLAPFAGASLLALTFVLTASAPAHESAAPVATSPEATVALASGAPTDTRTEGRGLPT